MRVRKKLVWGAVWLASSFLLAACDDDDRQPVGDADAVSDTGGDVQPDVQPDPVEDVEQEPDAPIISEPPELGDSVVEGLLAPQAAAANADGSVFYVTAYATGAEAAVYAVPADGGDPDELAAGAPLAYPIGLALNCDEDTLFVADAASDEDDETGGGGVFTLAEGGGTPAEIDSDGILYPTGLTLSPDCETLYLVGFNDAGEPALFTLGVAGGDADEVSTGDLLVQPVGVAVDSDGFAYVYDGGAGFVIGIDDAGDQEEIINITQAGTPGGIALSLDENLLVTLEGDTLFVLDLSTDDITSTTAAIADGGGLGRAIEADVYVAVDAEGGALFSAE